MSEIRVKKEVVRNFMKQEQRHEPYETSSGLAEAAADYFGLEEALEDEEHWLHELAQEFVPLA